MSLFAIMASHNKELVMDAMSFSDAHASQATKRRKSLAMWNISMQKKQEAKSAKHLE